MVVIKIPRKNVLMDILANLIFVGFIYYGLARTYPILPAIPATYFDIFKYIFVTGCLISLVVRKMNVYRYSSDNLYIRHIKSLSVVRESLYFPLMVALYFIVFPPFFQVSQSVEKYLFFGGVITLLIVVSVLYILDKRIWIVAGKLEAANLAS